MANIALPAAELIPMDLFERDEAIRTDLVYASADHPENIFGIALYHRNARLSLHKDLARVVLLLSRHLYRNHGWTILLKDGLRTIEAQKAMVETDTVRKNPHWLEEPRLVSGPGQGAHPRGMAIDVSLEQANGEPVDMGTVFDAMVPESARAYDGFSPAILQHRQILERAFLKAAETLSLPMHPLTSEWWDFRFPASYSSRFAPLSDADLPPSLRMRDPAHGPARPEPDFEQLAKNIILSI